MEGLRTKLEIGDGVSNAFVEVIDSSDIDIPDEQVTRIKTPVLSAANNRRKSVSKGTIEDGKFTFKQIYSAARLTRLQALKDTNVPIRVTLPDNRRATFTVEVYGAKIDPISAESEMMIAFDSEMRSSVTWDTAS